MSWTEPPGTAAVRGSNINSVQHLRSDRTVVLVQGRSDRLSHRELIAIAQSELWDLTRAPSQLVAADAERLEPRTRSDRRPDPLGRRSGSEGLVLVVPMTVVVHAVGICRCTGLRRLLEPMPYVSHLWMNDTPPEYEKRRVVPLKMRNVRAGAPGIP